MEKCSGLLLGFVYVMRDIVSMDIDNYNCCLCDNDVCFC